MRKRHSDPRRGRSYLLIGALCLLGSGLPGPAAAPTASDIVNTKHNLSVSGTGVSRAATETRICIFCHTPHNATPLSPLWNKAIEPQFYSVYASPSLRAVPSSPPTGATKLCLSCHDGTIAMGAVVNPSGGITMAGGGTLPPGSLSNFGLDLSGHHPVSFPYHTALPNAELEPTAPPEFSYGGADDVHCTTCHDPHKDLYGRFLVKDNRFSALCTTCHLIPGWAGSEHATETASVVGILPRPPRTWPNYTQLNEWGCETCHTPHFAPTPEKLLNFTAGPPAFSCVMSGCHDAQPPPPHGPPGTGSTGLPIDIARQTRKVSAHHETPGLVSTSVRGGGRTPDSRSSGVGCVDCHNPHVVVHQEAEAPYVSGMLRGVSGIDRNGGIVREATYEYEVCFKCHADASTDLSRLPRVISSTNVRLAFAQESASYHPVVSPGRNLDIPSIPSSFEPAMNPSQMIYCTSCHADDEGGSRGPHGSSFAPILKARYETWDNTPETFDNYALCYRCHDRSSILRDDSFRKKSLRSTPSGGGHSGHLAAGAPCSACHDPHGVPVRGATGTGSHTHLVNFDVRIVSPKSGSQYPVFNDTGATSGSCTLVCHGVAHDGETYP